MLVGREPEHWFPYESYISDKLELRWSLGATHLLIAESHDLELVGSSYARSTHIGAHTQV